MSLTLTSPVLANNGPISREYTCDDADIAPALAWSGAPQGTKSFALIVDDPDAPDPKAPKMTYVHWVLYDIPASSTGIAKGGAKPPGARSGSGTSTSRSWVARPCTWATSPRCVPARAKRSLPPSPWR